MCREPAHLRGGSEFGWASTMAGVSSTTESACCTNRRQITPSQLLIWNATQPQARARSADGFPIELGAGAMAITYRARDTVLNSVVALKVIDRKVAQHPGARSRFLREARLAAQIRHPNVARVSHYGEQDGECFYVMELVEGETLEARVRRNGPMPLALALEVIEQTAVPKKLSLVSSELRRSRAQSSSLLPNRRKSTRVRTFIR